MISDGLIISMVLSGILSLMGYKLKNSAVTFISSLGWLLCGLMIFNETSEVLPMILVLMLSISQVLLFKRD